MPKIKVSGFTIKYNLRVAALPALAAATSQLGIATTALPLISINTSTTTTAAAATTTTATTTTTKRKTPTIAATARATSYKTPPMMTSCPAPPRSPDLCVFQRRSTKTIQMRSGALAQMRKI